MCRIAPERAVGRMITAVTLDDSAIDGWFDAFVVAQAELARLDGGSPACADHAR
jgi:hypothetical protein